MSGGGAKRPKALPKVASNPALLSFKSNGSISPRTQSPALSPRQLSLVRSNSDLGRASGRSTPATGTPVLSPRGSPRQSASASGSLVYEGKLMKFGTAGAVGLSISGWKVRFCRLEKNPLQGKANLLYYEKNTSRKPKGIISLALAKVDLVGPNTEVAELGDGSDGGGMIEFKLTTDLREYRFCSTSSEVDLWVRHISDCITENLTALTLNEQADIVKEESKQDKLQQEKERRETKFREQLDALAVDLQAGTQTSLSEVKKRAAALDSAVSKFVHEVCLQHKDTVDALAGQGSSSTPAESQDEALVRLLETTVLLNDGFLGRTNELLKSLQNDYGKPLKQLDKAAMGCFSSFSNHKQKFVKLHERVAKSHSLRQVDMNSVLRLLPLLDEEFKGVRELIVNMAKDIGEARTHLSELKTGGQRRKATSQQSLASMKKKQQAAGGGGAGAAVSPAVSPRQSAVSPSSAAGNFNAHQLQPSLVAPAEGPGPRNNYMILPTAADMNAAAATAAGQGGSRNSDYMIMQPRGPSGAAGGASSSVDYEQLPADVRSSGYALAPAATGGQPTRPQAPFRRPAPIIPISPSASSPGPPGSGQPSKSPFRRASPQKQPRSPGRSLPAAPRPSHVQSLPREQIYVELGPEPTATPDEDFSLLSFAAAHDSAPKVIYSQLPNFGSDAGSPSLVNDGLKWIHESGAKYY